jgi:hypothetical protein
MERNTPQNHIEAMSGDEVEVDGVYANEAGREATLRRGDEFPADVMLGKTTWHLKGFSLNEATLDHIQREDTGTRTRVNGNR